MGRRSLASFFREYNRLAIACSGGTDSGLLLHEAIKFGADVLPIIADTPFVSDRELQSAIQLCRSEGLEPIVTRVDLLSIEGIPENTDNRCYLCKKTLFSAILDAAKAKGYDVVADGTNSSDDPEFRPGTKALSELGIKSPLREAGLNKSQIRRLALSQRMPVWNKPSNSCLATRVESGVVITEEILDRVAQSEDALDSMGYSDIRVITDGKNANVRLCSAQMPKDEASRSTIIEAIGEWFEDVSISVREPRA